MTRPGRLLVLARQHAAGKGVKDVEDYVQLIETFHKLAPHVPLKKKGVEGYVDLIETSHTLAPHVAVYVHGVELDVKQRARARERERERREDVKSDVCHHIRPERSHYMPILPTNPSHDVQEFF